MNLMICWTGKTMVDKAPDQKNAEKTDDDPKIQSGVISAVGVSSEQAGGADFRSCKGRRR